MQIFIDVTETLKSGLRTGVQRVVVELAGRLRSQTGCQLGAFDSRSGTFRTLTAEEERRLLDWDGTEGQTTRRESVSRFHRLLLGWGLFRPAAFAIDVLRSLTTHSANRYREGWEQTLYLTAEVVGDRARGRKLKAWFQRPGFRAAFIVHDLIPLTHPHLSLMDHGDFDRYLALLKQASLLVADSDETKAALETFVREPQSPRPKLRRLYPGFSQPPLLPVPARAKPLFLCVGTIEPRKNQERLLVVLEELWDQGREFQFVFVGGLSRLSAGFAQKVKAMVEAGLPVRWLSPATEEELELLYRGALATVYISSLEGFGLPVLESVSRGTPCIASTTGSVGEVARWFGGCVGVDPGVPESWKATMEAFLDEPELGATVLKTVRTDRFRNWDHYTEDLLQLLEDA